jgi:hypothetical protein
MTIIAERNVQIFRHNDYYLRRTVHINGDVTWEEMKADNHSDFHEVTDQRRIDQLERLT